MEGSRLRWLVQGAAVCLCACLAACGGEKQPTAVSQVIINSTPESDAEITVDGIPRGKTPASMSDLTPGPHEVIVKKERHEDAYQTIEVKGDGTAEQFTIELVPFVGYISVDTVPDGAEVYVNGELAGYAPIIQKALPVGKHTIEAKLANHLPATEEIEVERSYNYKKEYTLHAMEGTISVTSRPTGALIYLNNEQQSQTSPAKFTLPSGTYLVGVWAKGFVQEEKLVELEPNGSHEVDLVMKEGNVPHGMILIPEGEFVWGAKSRSPDETPRRTEKLKSYYIDKYEVTNAQFKEVFPEYTFPKGQELFPATGVSWNQAMKYAQAVGKRLPSEAEWEKAARGTDGREYPWGDQFDKSKCNSLESGLDAPVRVGARLHGASIYGAMDMAGNVAEWTFDWYDRYPGNLDVAKDYGQVYRVLRGGSYKSEMFDVRCARRHFDKVDAKKPEYGFRCAKDVE